MIQAQSKPSSVQSNKLPERREKEETEVDDDNEESRIVEPDFA